MTIHLVVDIGSSSSKVALYEIGYGLLPESLVTCPHSMTREPEGTAIFDAVQLRGEVETLIDRALTHPLANDISAVAFASFVGNLVGVDQAYHPMTPVWTYADTRTVEQTKHHVYHNYLLRQRTGCRLHTTYAPSWFLWMAEHQPDLSPSIPHWMDFITYCYTTWAGQAVPMSVSLASWTGLVNIEKMEWDSTWLGDLGLSEDQFPSLSLASACPIPITRWEKLKDAVWMLGIGDGYAAHLGSTQGDMNGVSLTIGTTCAIRQFTQQLPSQIESALWCYAVHEGAWLLGGATIEGGNLYQWARETLALPAHEACEQQLAQRAIGKHGLTILPHWGGERSPNWHPYAIGNIHGITFQTTALDILQALYESLASQLRVVFDELPTPPSAVILGGGAVKRSPYLAQLVCNSLNRPIKVIQGEDVTLNGLVWHTTTALGQATPPHSESSMLAPQASVAEQLTLVRDHQMSWYHLVNQWGQTSPLIGHIL